MYMFQVKVCKLQSIMNDISYNLQGHKMSVDEYVIM